jgi:hypothetical protein
MYSAPGNLLPVKHLSVNFGAPGDRKDSKGNLWLSYPRPRGGKTPEERRLVLDLEMTMEIPDGGEYFESNAEFLKIGGSRDPWIYSSGLEGIARSIIPIAREDGRGGKYTVRLHFHEPEDIQPGQRVFNVEIGGRTVLEALDIVKEAGGPRRALIKELNGLKLRDKLEISWKPLRGKPLICGIEIVAEGSRRAYKEL